MPGMFLDEADRFWAYMNYNIMHGMFLEEADRFWAYMNFGFLCSAGVLSNSPFATKEELKKRGRVNREIKDIFMSISRHYEGRELPQKYEEYFNAWYEFAEQQESNGHRLRRFVKSLKGRRNLDREQRNLDREQRNYLSDLSTFFMGNQPAINSLINRVA